MLSRHGTIQTLFLFISQHTTYRTAFSLSAASLAVYHTVVFLLLTVCLNPSSRREFLSLLVLAFFYSAVCMHTTASSAAEPSYSDASTSNNLACLSSLIKKLSLSENSTERIQQGHPWFLAHNTPGFKASMLIITQIYFRRYSVIQHQ